MDSSQLVRLALITSLAIVGPYRFRSALAADATGEREAATIRDGNLRNHAIASLAHRCCQIDRRY